MTRHHGRVRLAAAGIVALCATACAVPADRDVGELAALPAAVDEAFAAAAGPEPAPGEGSLAAPEGGAGPIAGGAADAPAVPVAPDAPAAPGRRRTAGTAPRPAATGAPATIAVGFQVSKNVTGAFAAVGAEGEPPEERRIVDALVAWANQHGGIAGRRIVPVVHETDPTAGSFATQAQAACADFTEDHRVFAVASSPVGGNDALLACMAQKGTPLLEQNHWLFDDDYYRRFGSVLYQPGKARPDRWVPAWVDGLAAQGYFKDAVLGLVRFDAPVFERLHTRLLVPRLRRHGVRPAAEVAIRTPGGVSDFGAMAAEINSAILRFRTAGVTHVMILENAAVMSFFWMPQAESSGFRPRYGMSSAGSPTTISNQAPAAQLARAVGVGWSPPVDVYDAQHPGGNPIWETCMAIIRAAGLSTGYKSQGYYVQPHCDSLFFLRAAMAAAPSFDRAGLRAGAAALGEDYQSPFAHRTRLGPGRTDGAAAWRAFAFDDACACWRYHGGLHPLP